MFWRSLLIFFFKKKKKSTFIFVLYFQKEKLTWVADACFFCLRFQRCVFRCCSRPRLRGVVSGEITQNPIFCFWGIIALIALDWFIMWLTASCFSFQVSTFEIWTIASTSERLSQIRIFHIVDGSIDIISFLFYLLVFFFRM